MNHLPLVFDQFKIGFYLPLNEDDGVPASFTDPDIYEPPNSID